MYEDISDNIIEDFKSFLTMSPADRKQIIDRVFNLEAVNIAFEKIKKDGRDISAAINSDNSTLFQLGQTFQRATNELTALQEKFKNEVNKTEIEERLRLIFGRIFEIMCADKDTEAVCSLAESAT